MGGECGMGGLKIMLAYIGLYTVVYIVTRTVLRANKKQYNITHYYPQNAINI